MNRNQNFMKAILSLMIAALAAISPISAQSYLNREFFALPRFISLQQYISFDIGDVDIDKTGIGVMWDFSQLSLEQLDAVYNLQAFPDPDPRFANNTFRMIAKEGGSPTSTVELFSLTDGLLLFRGLGMIDDKGRLEMDIFTTPYRLMRFPWIMGESFFEDHQFRSSTRTLDAKGSLILPGENEKQACKFTDRFSEGNTNYVEHTWFTDSIPYPILIIRDAYSNEDSRLLSRSVDVLKQRSAMSLQADVSNSQESLPIYSNGNILVQKGIIIQQIFDVKGEIIPFELVSDGRYIIPQASQQLFIVYLDAHQEMKTHIIQAIQ